ncbi:MAG: FkbM family methyltransferase [Proteobacteria bacterium]|nr:FkbM family methyltransferase [Pseudomonadota bacterium]
MTGQNDIIARLERLARAQETQLMLAGRQACWALRGRKLECLADAEFKVSSQFGEDGIIEWLVQTLPQGDERFVEFGVENYREANTRFLLQNRNWKGLILDGGAGLEESLHADGELLWRHDLTAASVFITAENIDELLTRHGYTGEIGLLSVDIDGNDYWVLNSIRAVSPRILVVEYNSIFGDRWPVSIPYQPDYTRFAGHHSGLYFGASIQALLHWAGENGYGFAGTCSNGINAFFVRDDLFPQVRDRLAATRSFPSRHRDARDSQGRLAYTGGRARTELIMDLPLVRVDTMAPCTLRELGDPFTPD